MIVYNRGDKPVFIVTDYEVDPKGGPARHKASICVSPGDGIDLDVIKFTSEPIKENIIPDIERSPNPYWKTSAWETYDIR